MYWYILFRNNGRELAHMVVAWLDDASAHAEAKAYIDWDRKASGASGWELVQIQRKQRSSYFKPVQSKNDPDDAIEYHWVWEDYQEHGQGEQLLQSFPVEE